MAIFTRNEKSRKYFANLPQTEQEELARNQMIFLQKVFGYSAAKGLAELAASATSLYRCPEANADEGGSPTSRHIKALAGDWPASVFPKFKGGTREKMAKFGDLAWYHFCGRKTGMEMIHVEWRKP